VSSVVKYFIGRDALTSSFEGNINVESDCEGDTQGDSEEPQKAKEDKEEPVRAVLVAGSFSAYVLPHLSLSHEK
jgi:hypothetical protein